MRDPYDLAVVAVALAGACFGFLWWNAEPAKIFMGDTGSLSLGGALAGMAIFTRTELLLVILGGLLVIEVMSVILQTGFFKLTKGRRLFKMSPLHHHFELLNWAQVTIVMRFWIICGLFVAAGLGHLLRRMGSGRDGSARALAPGGGAWHLPDSSPPSPGGATRVPDARACRSAGHGVDWLPQADGASPWEQAHVVVAGLGVSGFAAADGLLEFGARVTVARRRRRRAQRRQGRLLETLGAHVRLGPRLDRRAARRRRPGDHHRLEPARTRCWSRPPAAACRSGARSSWPGGSARPAKIVPWLGVTGTNGKTTTTQMLESMLRAAGLRTAAVGNIGRPVMETVLDPEPYDVLAVELSSHQLHWSHSLALHSAAVLNLQPDHLEWHGGRRRLPGRQGQDLRRGLGRCVYNVADPATERMVEEAEVVEGARAIGFTLGTPALSMLGVVDDLLVDRAFIEQRRDSALELAKVADVAPVGRAPHNVENALAAAALARSFGVPATAVRDGLRAVALGAHKIETVSPSGTGSASSTTPRPPTRTPPTPPCGPSSRWSGSPAARPRAPTSTTWCSATQDGCGVPSCWASTGR